MSVGACIGVSFERFMPMQPDSVTAQLSYCAVKPRSNARVGRQRLGAQGCSVRQIQAADLAVYS
jgi:hypothetical protein